MVSNEKVLERMSEIESPWSRIKKKKLKEWIGRVMIRGG